jgi:cell division topological specificity factor
MSFWKRLFGQQEPTSREIAKKRLQLALTVDRTRISPHLLETLKDEIIAVISQHVDIEPDGVVVSLTQQRSEHRLVAEIPLANARRRRE